MKNKKGFMYIIFVTFLIIFISILFLSIKDNPDISSLEKKIAENYDNEFNQLVTNDLNIDIINKFNYSFYNYTKSHSYDSKICSIIKRDDYIYLSNYLEKDCNLYINNDFNQTIVNNSTIKIDRFINDTNIYLCNCISENNLNDNIYYINIYNNQNNLIFKNN